MCNDAAQASIGGAKHESVSAGIARAPQANTRRINFRARLEIGDRATTVCDLLPWIDVSAEVASARPEIAMIVNKHDKTRRGQCQSETLKTVFLGSPKAVRHGDSGADAISLGQE
jgi:hypothetical protein